MDSAAPSESMSIPVVDLKGEASGEAPLVAALFDRALQRALLHQVVVSNFANARIGTRAQKTRAEVSFSTAKPWRQKGGGRARAGMRSSPIWRGGGRAFPSSPDENFQRKINRKMFRAAMAVALSQLRRENRLLVVESLVVREAKTRVAAEARAALKIGARRALIIDSQWEDDAASGFARAASNLPDIRLLALSNLTPALVVGAEPLVLTRRALAEMQTTWAPQ